MDSTLDRLSQTTTAPALRSFLDSELRDALPGKKSRSASVGIVLRIWSGIPRERMALRDRAVALLPSISGQERIWLHWGMAALAYPFFRDTAEVVGRLLALQDDFTTAQVLGRMLTTWGDRATSREAAQKLITTLVDWEVLRSTTKKGQFLLARKMTTNVPALQLWLLEALLGASSADEIDAQQLLRLPESFPFNFSVGIADLRKHEGFDIHRQGLNTDMVALRKVKLEPPPKPARPSKVQKPRSAEIGLFDKATQKCDSADGKPMPVVPAAVLPLGEQQNGQTDAQKLKEAIKEELVRTLSVKTAGLPKVQAIISERPFASPSAECIQQFRLGNYFGSIALAHAVLEAVIRHVWRIKLKKKLNQNGEFIKNVKALQKKKLISDDVKTGLDQIWAERSSFLHLNPEIEMDIQRLKSLARNTLILLNNLEREIFGFAVQDRIVAQPHPEHNE
jgi:hypothetical protein